MVDVKVSKDKYFSRWVDKENIIYVRWTNIKNRAQKCNTSFVNTSWYVNYFQSLILVKVSAFFPMFLQFLPRLLLTFRYFS